MNKLLKIRNIVLTVILTVGFILIGVYCFQNSYYRLIEGFNDLWESMRYFGRMVFGIRIPVDDTINNYSTIMEWNILLPEDWQAFTVQAGHYFSLLVDESTFIGYGGVLYNVLVYILVGTVLILPLVLIIFTIIKSLYARSNNKHNKDTLPLRIFKWITRYSYVPIKRFVASYVEFVKERNYIWITWLAIWVIQFNLGSIAVSFVAYYLYFAVTYRFDTLYIQVVKLIIDLQVMFKFFPWWVLLIVVYPIFHRFREKIARDTLQHYEARNCGFIKELPIVSLTCAKMGKKKTTMITDMALSQEVMMRQKAFELLQKNDMKFPFFPWICFEKELRTCMEYGTVRNLATAKDWVNKKRKRYFKHGNKDLQLYGYDVNRYGYTYNDGLVERDLFDVLETYAQLYFIYVIMSSLILSNYSIRTDNQMIDYGNFPLWVMDFFPKTYSGDSRYSHILDFDVLRLGKKVLENNPNAGSFEFGVLVITEIGKERGNNLELKEVKKGMEETNQKNDLFNSWLKMCRHSATVDNFPFIKVFTDEQRPESWGADARDLTDVLHIADSGEQKLALPFYTIEEMVSDWMFNKFVGLYYDFRFKRGDNTLLVHLLKGITAWMVNRKLKMYNRYGYSVLTILKEDGTMDGKKRKKKYFLMNGKIYRARFTTDCFSEYFNELARKSKAGINDYLEYMTEKASVEELKKQNSYFMNSLYKDAS